MEEFCWLKREHVLYHSETIPCNLNYKTNTNSKRTLAMTTTTDPDRNYEL